jgi:hypothetical protein
MRGRSERARAAGQVEPVTVTKAATKGSVLRLVWVVGALLLLAFYKPWGTGSRTPPVSAYLSVETPQVSPTPRPSTELDMVAGFCLEPSGWRVYSSERWGGQQVRSWTAMTPIGAAIGPTDPRIPVIPVVSQAVLAIGFCAPVSGSDKPPADATQRIFRVTAITIAGEGITRAEALAPLRVEPESRPSYLGAAYAPLAGDSWSDGVYVVHVEGSGYSRWFGIQVETLNPAPSGS